MLSVPHQKIKPLLTSMSLTSAIYSTYSSRRIAASTTLYYTGLDANVSSNISGLLLTLASSPIHYHEVDAALLRESKRSPKLMTSKLKSVVKFFVKDGKHR